MYCPCFSSPFLRFSFWSFINYPFQEIIAMHQPTRGHFIWTWCLQFSSCLLHLFDNHLWVFSTSFLPRNWSSCLLSSRPETVSKQNTALSPAIEVRFSLVQETQTTSKVTLEMFLFFFFKSTILFCRLWFPPKASEQCYLVAGAFLKYLCCRMSKAEQLWQEKTSDNARKIAKTGVARFICFHTAKHRYHFRNSPFSFFVLSKIANATSVQLLFVSWLDNLLLKFPIHLLYVACEDGKSITETFTRIRREGSFVKTPNI